MLQHVVGARGGEGDVGPVGRSRAGGGGVPVGVDGVGVVLEGCEDDRACGGASRLERALDAQVVQQLDDCAGREVESRGLRHGDGEVEDERESAHVGIAVQRDRPRDGRVVQAETVPVRFGPDKAAALILIALVLAVALNIVLLQLAPVGFGLPSMIAYGLTGLCLLLWPAYHLYRVKGRSNALRLFSRASFYPLTLLAIVTFVFLFRP